MALFKIFKGNKSGLPTAIKNGYMYITKDGGDIYVDTDDSTRMHINANYANAFRQVDTNSPLAKGDDLQPIYLDSNGQPADCLEMVTTADENQIISGIKTFENQIVIANSDITVGGSCTLEYNAVDQSINFVFA